MNNPKRAMAIRHHVTILVAACTLGGLALMSGLVITYSGFEKNNDEIIADSVSLRQMQTLEDELKAWLLEIDVFLHSAELPGSSYLAAHAGERGQSIMAQARALRSTRLLDKNRNSFTDSIKHMMAVNDDIELASRLHGENRSRLLPEIRSRVEERSVPIVAAIDTLQERMKAVADSYERVLAQDRDFVRKVTWLAGPLYLLIVLVFWRWTTVKLVRPLQGLTEAAREAMNVDRKFRLKPDGPLEVRQLGADFSSLVQRMERARDDMKIKAAEHEAILESIHAILIGVDPSGHVVLWNEMATRSFGLIPAQTEGRRIDKCKIPWSDAQVARKVSRSMRNNEPSMMTDLLFVDTKGKNRVLSATITPVRYSNHSTGMIFLGTDVTEQKSLESQLRHAQKLESVGQLAAGIAHEINTPIQYVGDSIHFLQDAFVDLQEIVGSYRTLKGSVGDVEEAEKLIAEIEGAEEEAEVDVLEEEVPSAIERAIEGISRVSGIVGAMKRFAHPGGQNMAPVDINEALRTTLTVARNEYKYIADVKEEFGEIPNIVCDLGDLNQVFLNLIVNAAHAIESKIGESDERGTITIRTRRHQGYVFVQIKDSGTGIDEEIRSRIFDPFFTTKEVGKGTGQGLAIAHSIVVEKHGGNIEIESAPGEGCTFTVALPIEQRIAT